MIDLNSLGHCEDKKHNSCDAGPLPGLEYVQKEVLTCIIKNAKMRLVSYI